MQPDEPLYVLSIDIGTSGVRSSVFDSLGNEIEELRVIRLSEDREDPSEFDPELLLQLVIECIDEVAVGCDLKEINPSFAGISCFWHSLLGVAGDGRPLTPLYTWADTRAANAAVSLRTRLDEVEIHIRTGCHFHSSYWPAKLIRLRESDPAVCERTFKWLSFGDLLHSRLTGDLVTSVSMASGTGLFDQRRCVWDDELARECGISAEDLPEIASEGDSGRLRPEYDRRWPSLSDSWWLPAIGDGAANNLGADCVDADRAVLMVGTSAAFRVLYEGEVPDEIPEGLFCYRLDRGRVVLGGALSDGGSLYRWLTETLAHKISDALLEDRYRDRSPGYHGLTFLPFVFGERSTGYHAEAKGAVIGITRGTDAADIAIAAMEGIAYRLSGILSRIEKVTKPKEIVGSGGAIEASGFLAQLIADVLGRDLLKTDTELASLRGAALYAFEMAGISKPNSSAGDSRILAKCDRDRHGGYSDAKRNHKRFYQKSFPDS
ncbi:MAG TPA: gluconokinase [Aridibacter sp.]|nr:gluconokinase [Aridibacter sp.]